MRPVPFRLGLMARCSVPLMAGAQRATLAARGVSTNVHVGALDRYGARGLLAQRPAPFRTAIRSVLCGPKTSQKILTATTVVIVDSQGPFATRSGHEALETEV